MMNREPKGYEQLKNSRKIFDQWPSWKKDFLITEYSERVKSHNERAMNKASK